MKVIDLIMSRIKEQKEKTKSKKKEKKMTYLQTIQEVASRVIQPKTMIGLCLLLLLIRFKGWIKNKNSCVKRSSSDKAHGILFGKSKGKIVYSPTDTEGHVAVFGGSGTGKTSALLIPTLKSWTGTSFTIDICGDIYKNVASPDKLVYEPADPNTIPFNIFGAIDDLKDEDDKNEALEELAFLLMPDDDRMSDASKFFHTEGRKILTACLIAFYFRGLDFIEICEKMLANSWVALFEEIDNTNNPKAKQYINSFLGTSDQNTAGCKQAADAAIKLFATNARIKRSIRRPHKGEQAFMPAVLEKRSVFVVIDDTKLKLYAPLLQILTAQSLEYFSNRSNDNNSTILFALDEFVSLGKLEITDALRKLRKKHIRIMMLTQSLSDLDLVYGADERKAMMNNFAFKAILSASDTETQEYFSKLIGYTNVKKRSTSKNSRSTTKTESEVKDYIIEPSDLAHLKERLILLSPDGYEKLKKNYYYM